MLNQRILTVYCTIALPVSAVDHFYHKEMHTCGHLYQLVRTERRGFFLIATLVSLHCGHLFSLKLERTGLTQNYPLLKVLGYCMFNMIISGPSPKIYPSFKRP